MAKLGINIDHVATLRQARREFDPDPIAAARICEAAGCNSIVAHLREDRRHINDGDIRTLRQIVKTRFNMEMSLDPKIVRIASLIKPDQATLVPERRQEITTEGGLDVIAHSTRIKKTILELRKKGIPVSIFIDPDPRQINRAFDLGAEIIELHTGRYAQARSSAAMRLQLKKLSAMTLLAQNLGITVNAGHGLNYQNTKAIAMIEGIEELNIGHAVVSRAVFVGLKQAVEEMLELTR